MNITSQIADKQMEKTPFKKYLSFGLSVVGNLQHYYKQAPVEVAQKLLGSIFPEKLTYEKNTFRTTKPNEAFAFMTSNIKGLEGYKNKKVGKIADQSSVAPPDTHLLNPLYESLKRLSILKAALEGEISFSM